MDPRSDRPEIPALRAETGNRLGDGKDNLVHALEIDPSIRSLTSDGDWVVKVGHTNTPAAREKRQRIASNNIEAAKSGVAYKKNKYEILKHFIGDHIPVSMFLVADANEGEATRPAEITIQRRVPDVQLNHLTKEQQEDPRLHANIIDLLQGLQYMYSVVGEANARTSQQVSLDTKLDLGTISSFVRAESFDREFDKDDARKSIRKIDSPNLLVDPETMQVYCIDFDQGDWSPGMDEAKELVFEIDAKRQEMASYLGGLALRGQIQERLPRVS